MQNFKKYRRSYRPIIFTALLILCLPGYSQKKTPTDSVFRVLPCTYIQISSIISAFSNDKQFRLSSSLITHHTYRNKKNLIFFDSLELRASKNIITKKLYDFIIVSPDTISQKQITGTSDAGYINYSGKKIRNIIVERINVFGTNINNPLQHDPKKLENILNKTHINTNENIIRKNLLFAEGDNISPLILSDNERLLRQLSFIDDARIIAIHVSENEADILVLTKDVYSLGADFRYQGLKKGSISVFEKNILGIGHELGFDIPYNSDLSDSPGFGVHYFVDNISKSFINLNMYLLGGLGEKTYGFSLNRNFVSSTTKYAGGISVKQMSTTEDLNKTLPAPEPFKFNFQDYWLSRSFMINKESVSRLIIGARYTNNNVFDRPAIQPDSYYHLQKYWMYLGSATFSIQKYYKTNLIYGYGRTEDIPYGGLFRVTAGREYNEFNEFRKRTYMGAEIALGKSNKTLGYFYTSAGLASFLNGTQTKQGIVSINMKYISNLVHFGNHMIRNFIYINYIRGFDRNTDEILVFNDDNGFSGFKNDSVNGKQRLSFSLESVIFSPFDLYGFRFALFGFTDFSFLSLTNEIIGNGTALSSLGLGIRIRNHNLVFNTFQVRIGFFPNPPQYSKINNLNISGEQLLNPNNFDSGPPLIIPYR